MKPQAEMDITRMLTITVFLCSAITLSRSEILLFATPGGRGLTAGFYGGYLDINKYTFPRKIFKINQDCLDLHVNEIQELMIKSVYLDEKSGYVLLHAGSPTQASMVTLLRAPLCQRIASTSCSQSVMLKPIMANVNINTYFISAFASYDDKIYFISEKEETDGRTNLRTKVIELRNLTGCENKLKLPYTSSSIFYIDRCSTVIANITKERDYSVSQYYPTSGLAIVSTASGLVFYTQIIHNSMDTMPGNSILPEDSMILKRITQDGHTESAAEEYITSEHRNYIMQGIGQITRRKDVLCWSAMDRIICAKLDGRARISQTTTVMPTGRASAVCSASPQEEFLSTVTTGVAIAKVPSNMARDEIAVYFGCLAQSRGLGGAGLVRKHGAGNAKIQRMRENSTTLYAGSMLVTDRCSEAEAPEPYSVESGSARIYSIDLSVIKSLFPLLYILYIYC